MNESELLLVEAFKSFLGEKARLGLDQKAGEGGDSDPRLRGAQYLHGEIDDLFAHKAAELTHHTGVCAAFAKVHSYKYLDDDTFTGAMDNEMVAQGIPAAERRATLEFIPAIIKELQEDAADWRESDFGFHPDLDGVMGAGMADQHSEGG